jgi:hypothetical protein
MQRRVSQAKKEQVRGRTGRHDAARTSTHMGTVVTDDTYRAMGLADGLGTTSGGPPGSERRPPSFLQFRDSENGLTLQLTVA